MIDVLLILRGRFLRLIFSRNISLTIFLGQQRASYEEYFQTYFSPKFYSGNIPQNLLLEKYFEPKYFSGSRFLADKYLGVGRAQRLPRVISSTRRDRKLIAEGRVKPTSGPPHTCRTRRMVLVPSLLSCGSLSSCFGCNTHSYSCNGGYRLLVGAICAMLLFSCSRVSTI